MKAELFDRWLNALKSGNYRRAKGKLKARNFTCANHCCLGVLLDLVAKERDMDYLDKRMKKYKSEQSLSWDAKDEFGLDDRYVQQLMGINDGVFMYKGKMGCTGRTYDLVIEYLEDNRNEIVR